MSQNTLASFLMDKLIFLGTAAAVASRHRDNTAFLLKLSKPRPEFLLVDCPGSIVAKLYEVGVDFRKIKAVFLTHGHPDHIYGLASLIHSLYRVTGRLDIFGTKETLKVAKGLVCLFCLDDSSRYPFICYHTIRPDDQSPLYQNQRLAVTAFGVRHSQGSVGFSFYLKDKRKKIVITGDTSPGEDIFKVAKGCAILIHDCFAPEAVFSRFKELKTYHTSSLALGVVARRLKAQTLIPVHFATEVKYPFALLKREIRRNFPGRLIFPKDLEGISF